MRCSLGKAINWRWRSIATLAHKSNATSKQWCCEAAGAVVQPPAAYRSLPTYLFFKTTVYHHLSNKFNSKGFLLIDILGRVGEIAWMDSFCTLVVVFPAVIRWWLLARGELTNASDRRALDQQRCFFDTLQWKSSRKKTESRYLLWSSIILSVVWFLHLHK